MKSPAVYLIGAGPGDPDLITVRGRDCLQRADVVIYDHLVPARLLGHARRDAELIDVGTAAPQPMAQEAIGYLLADKAREGKLVARLKWGDPFVFDRGGEEALFLRQHQIGFEVVPGIPAGLAVPAYAGVPATYSGAGDTITLVRGYEDESRQPPRIDWTSLIRLQGTIVCYVGAHQLPKVLQSLRSHGCPADMPALIVYDGATPRQTTHAGSVGELIESLREHTRRDPAILVVGRVVGVRHLLRWYDARPLFGRRILVTRAREQAAELTDRLAALGAEAIVMPMIRIQPPDDPRPLRDAASRAGAFDWIVFSSANAVDAFMHVLLDGTRDLRALKGPLLCAVGTGTAERLARFGVRVDLVPDEFRAEAVVRAMLQHGAVEGARILLPRADIGREVLGEQLRRAGAAVTDVIAYRTVLSDIQREDDPDVYGMLLRGEIDVVTFASASAVRNFAQLYGAEQVADLLRQTLVATIGPVTTETAVQLGIAVTIQPQTYTIPALVQAIAAHLAPVTPAGDPQPPRGEAGGRHHQTRS